MDRNFSMAAVFVWQKNHGRVSTASEKEGHAEHAAADVHRGTVTMKRVP
jgi:hypothetical protein